MTRDLTGIENVHSFVTLAEELSFRRTAERLNLDQSALSRRIQKLEASLGFRLLERTTRAVSLTQAGRSFYEENAHLLRRYEASVRLARRVADGKLGALTIGYMAFAATELMPSAVARFRQLHPHVDLKIRYIRTQGQKIALAHDEIDAGYMIGPFDHADYHTLPLSDDPLYVVTPCGHALQRVPVLTPADLAGQNLILGDTSEWDEYRWRLDSLFSAEGVALDVTLEASNTLALIGLVAAGLGVTIYPESLIGFLGRNVEVRQITHPAFRSCTVLAWKRSNRSRQIRDFIEVAKMTAAPAG
ncbi:LysR family transcriptional regulator [Paracoccus denitrificans]|uniref:LysR family transcriptional regulator n=1 Tax=Paracoccus denitrificans TaxID=266 RepID=UPI000CEC450A|nr:LysR family transcriptional regulator [Paracoccus denitrificans]